MRFHLRDTSTGSARRSKNSLSPWGAPLACEALEERRLLSVNPNDNGLTALLDSGLTIREFSVSDGVRTQQEGDLYFRPDRLSIKFSNSPSTSGGTTGEHSASNPANWRLLKDGQDVSYLIAGVQVSTNNAVLSLADTLAPGSYRLVASRNIQDVDGESIRGISGLQYEDWSSSPFVVLPLVETAPEISIKSDRIQFGGVQADAEGNYVLIYSMADFQNNENPLFAQRFDRTGQRIGGEILITTERWASSIDLAMNAAGAFVISWRLSVDHGNPQVFVKRFTADGVPVGETIQIRVTDPFVNWTTSAAIDDAGSCVVVWSSSDVNGQNHIWAQRFSTDGTLLGDPILVGVGEQAQVAISAGGEFVVVWKNSMQDAVYAQLFHRDGTKHGERIEIKTSVASYSPVRVAMSASGAFAVLYEADHGNVDLLIQRFDAVGNFAGPATKVGGSTGRLGDFGETTLSMDRVGRMVVTWASGRDYGSYATPQVYPPQSYSPIYHYAQFFDANGAAIAAPVSLSGQIAFGANGAVISAEYLTSSLATTNARGDEYLPVMRNPLQIIQWPETGIYVRHYSLPPVLTIDLNGDPPGVDYKSNYLFGGPPAALSDPHRSLIYGAATDQLTSMTVTILDYFPGDLLAIATVKQGIAVSFDQGVLRLSGAASVTDYQELLRELTFKSTAARLVGSTVQISIVVSDGTGMSGSAQSKISIHEPGRSSIAARHIFYNNSGFDDSDPAVNAGDDAAIATDKVALLPNQTATFANYTSYTRGINGIIVDLAGQHGTITADDFIFRTGNSNNTAHWAYAPQPLSVVVRAGAGVGGSDRVEIIWADGVIKNTWLQVIVLDNGDTGLAAPDIFMFGNQVAEAGNEPGDTHVGAVDVMRVVNRLLAGGDRTAPFDSPIDFNRDGQITTLDLMAALNQALANDSELELIRVEDESAMDGAIVTGITGRLTVLDFSSFEIAEYLPAPEVSPFGAWQEDDDLDLLATQLAAPSPLMLDPNAE